MLGRLCCIVVTFMVADWCCPAWWAVPSRSRIEVGQCQSWAFMEFTPGAQCQNLWFPLRGNIPDQSWRRGRSSTRSGHEQRRVLGLPTC